MKIEIKDLDKNVKEVTIEMEPSKWLPYLDLSYQELAKQEKIAGFRPGQAPLELVKKHIKQEKAQAKMLEILIKKELAKILEQRNWLMAEGAKIDILKFAPDNPLVFKAVFSVWPKVIKLIDFSSIKVKKQKLEVKEDEIERELNELQKMQAKERIVLRPAKIGDKVILDFNILKDLVPQEGGEYKDFSMILGEDFYLPGFSENIVGLKAGDEKTFKLTIPQDHQNKNLAGQEVDFKVKIKDVYEIVLPELNDEFAKSLGKFENLEQLKQAIKLNLEKIKQVQINEKYEREILEEIIEKSEFEEIPEVVLEKEVERMLEELKISIQNQASLMGVKMSFEDYLSQINKTESELKKDLEIQAEKRIKIGLVLQEVIEKENISVSDQEIEKEIENLKLIYKNDSEILKEINSLDYKKKLKSELLAKKAIEKIQQLVESSSN